MKFNRKDAIHRKAIWEIYNKKCQYCNSKIDLYDGKLKMQVDHIISKDVNKSPQKLKNAIAMHNLPENFDIESLSNAIPSCPICNNKKK